jgi:hypothetical protein
MTTMEKSVHPLLAAVRPAVEEAGVFAAVELRDGMLECQARDAAADAFYRLQPVHPGDASPLAVSLVTPDRWLSESIEADLMHYGDPIEELIEEELVELGWSGAAPIVKHFRSDDLLYTFTSEVPAVGSRDEQARTAAIWLLAYEAAFRELGDMTAADEE